ncbi:MAG: TetR/AcrR family transcriptional regulator [Bdellovibrionota bacterium]
MPTDSHISASTRDKILNAAENLIKSFGYNGFSYEDISKSVGIKKSSIHHHFSTKSELGVAVVQRYSERSQEKLELIESNYSSPKACLKAYVEIFVAAYDNNSQELCLCGILAAESKSLSQEVFIELQKFFTMNSNWLTSIFKQGKNLKELTYVGDARDQALAFLSSLEGAMVVGKAFKSPDFVKKIGATLMKDLLQ